MVWDKRLNVRLFLVNFVALLVFSISIGVAQDRDDDQEKAEQRKVERDEDRPRDGYRPRERNGDRPREGDRPRDGRFGPRDGRFGPRDGDGPPRDGRFGPRDGDGPPRDGRFGPRDGSERREMNPGPPPELTDEQVKTVIEIIEARSPEHAERVRKGMERNAKRVRPMLRGPAARVWWLVREKEKDSEMYELHLAEMRNERESAGQVRRYREAKRRRQQEKLQEIRAKLAEIEERRFDIQQKIQERQLQRFRQRIEAMENALKERADQREKHVRERMSNLLGENDDDTRQSEETSSR